MLILFFLFETLLKLLVCHHGRMAGRPGAGKRQGGSGSSTAYPDTRLNEGPPPGAPLAVFRSTGNPALALSRRRYDILTLNGCFTPL